jgi:cytochrome c oxidase assembly protein subunit 15
MGCPDWPKCFGAWVPPTSVSELPSNYKEIYASYREKKNVRFAKYLNAFGMESTAEQILQDKSILQEADFNPVKTLIEYLNRVLGVIIGFLIFAVFAFSLRYWKSNRKITFIAFAAFVLVGFQGWIGSFVVSTNLTPWTITVHMFLALLIVSLLIYLVTSSTRKSSLSLNSPFAFWWLIACITVLLVQILLGTQVREAIDRVAGLIPRDSWIANIEAEFIIHRSFSWIILLLHAGLIMKLRKTQGSKVFPIVLILLILGTILTGTAMAWFAVPPFLQPVHLLLATATFGVQFLFLLKLNQSRNVVIA